MFRAARALAHARRATRALHASRRTDANIVCSDPVHPSFVSTCEARGHSVVAPSSTMDPQSLRAALQEAHGLVVRSATKVDATLLADAPSLRVIGRAGAGLDNVDVAAATQRNLPVISTPHGPTISAAELTLALLTALARRVPQAAGATTPLDDLVDPAGAGSHRTAPSDLQGKVAGVIGLGRIGREVAAFCKAAGMHVVGYDPLLSQQVTRASGIEQLTLGELYRVSDIVTVHTPLTESTRGLVGAAELAACKPGVLLVNCARGGIVDEAALLDALRSGHVAGAALDVFSEEPPTEDVAPLLQHPNVLCTPHIGASTKDASLRIATQLAVRMCDALDGRRLRGAVNSPAAEMVTQRDLIPYVGLAEKLGSLQMQLLAGRLRRVVIQTQGAVVTDGEVTDLISRAALAGMLGRLLEEDVNLMNALGLAEELGLSVALQRGGDGGSDAFGYANMVSIRFETDAGTKTLRGGVHEDGQARLVGVDDYRLDIVPEGDMLVFSNEDRPGILCNVTSVLADAGINIANFELGRHSGKLPPLPGTEREDPAAPRTPGLALSVFSLDDPVTKEARDRLRALDHISDVRVASVPAWTDHVVLDTQARSYPLHAETRPAVRPDCPHFGSGPTKKPPGWSLRELRPALTGRSHRSREGKARLAAVVDETHRILGLPDDYRVGIVPGSDTGAFEMAMWTMLGQRPVDVCYWDAFGKGWHTDINQELKLDNVRTFEAGYGWLPQLSGTDPSHDIVFPWNGTTSGVCVPHGDWIAADRSGLTLCDATSAVFAMDLPWDKLDVTTYSWQKVLGGEGGHGMIILSPRAVERLESYRPPWPVPKVMRLTSDSKLIEGIFRGNTINTPSMLCVEDYSYALAWADSIGGMPALVRRSKDNLAAVEEFVLRTDWCSFLAKEVGTISNTSVCLELDGVSADQIKIMQEALESEGVAFDIGSYRDAPAGLRLWCGATVERSDLEALMPWLEWAYDVATS